MKTTKRPVGHFRVDTCAFLAEIANCGLPQSAGVLKIPLNVFKGLLAQVAERATQLNDPIMNALMFDLTLYDVPYPTTPAYSKLMRKLYREAEAQRKKEKLSAF